MKRLLILYVAFIINSAAGRTVSITEGVITYIPIVE